jgi:hypothetical protein
MGSMSVMAPLEARRRVHPRVRRDDEERRCETADDEREATEEVGAWCEAIPAVEVERQEDRLDEEGEALEAERHADDAAGEFHEPRPEQPELEREHRAGDGADAEGHREGLRPGAGELAVDVVLRAQPEAFGDHEQDGHADAEHREADVERERRAHLDSCCHQFGHTALPSLASSG